MGNLWTYFMVPRKRETSVYSYFLCGLVPFASWQKWPLWLAHPLVLRPPAPGAILHQYLCLLG